MDAEVTDRCLFEVVHRCSSWIGGEAALRSRRTQPRLVTIAPRYRGTVHSLWFGRWVGSGGLKEDQLDELPQCSRDPSEHPVVCSAPPSSGGCPCRGQGILNTRSVKASSPLSDARAGSGGHTTPIL